MSRVDVEIFKKFVELVVRKTCWERICRKWSLHRQVGKVEGGKFQKGGEISPTQPDDIATPILP